jgi:hypothetical protein
MDIQGMFEKFSISNMQSNLFGGVYGDDTESTISNVIIIILIVVVVGILLYKLYKNFNIGVKAEGFDSMLNSNNNLMSPQQFQMKFKNGHYENFNNAHIYNYDQIKNFIISYSNQHNIVLSDEKIEEFSKYAYNNNLVYEGIAKIISSNNNKNHKEHFNDVNKLNNDPIKNFIISYIATENISFPNEEIVSLSKYARDNSLNQFQVIDLVNKRSNMNPENSKPSNMTTDEKIELETAIKIVNRHNKQEKVKHNKINGNKHNNMNNNKNNKMNENKMNENKYNKMNNNNKQNKMNNNKQNKMNNRQNKMSCKMNDDQENEMNDNQENEMNDNVPYDPNVNKQVNRNRQRLNNIQEEIENFNILTADQMENLNNGDFDINSYETTDNFTDKKKN